MSDFKTCSVEYKKTANPPGTILPFIQPKLTINNPHDEYEKQADTMAEKVMRMDMPFIQKKRDKSFSLATQGELNGVQRKCAHCEEESAFARTSADKEKLQRKEMNSGEATSDNELENYIANLSGGQPLSNDLRSFYEPRFGYDFSDVRLHTDSIAAQSAQSISSSAYTAGNHIVFNNGQYLPETSRGKELLAHELTHVVQQSSGIQAKPMVQRGPLDLEPDVCITVPGLGTVCGSDAAKVCSERNLPGCKAVCKLFHCRKPSPEPKTKCPVGFRPSRAKPGQCCPAKSEVDLHTECCTPDKITTGPFQRCCHEDEKVDKDRCVKPSKPKPKPADCPDNQPRAADGTCCAPPKIIEEGKCVDPPPPRQPVPVIEKNSVIGFKKDAPQTWYSPSSSFSVSVTTEGKSNFTELASFLQQNPAVKIQIEGHASSEKPKGDPDYNQRLTDRRVTLISSELQKKGIDAARFEDIPGDPDTTGCIELSAGVLSCGDAQAQTTVEATDRNVSVKAFEIK